MIPVLSVFLAMKFNNNHMKFNNNQMITIGQSILKKIKIFTLK